MRNIKNINELTQLLSAKNIDTSKWGTGTTKTTNDLWNEIRNGESIIQDEPLLRIVDVINVIIRNGESVLIETSQELDDGRTRSRNIVPAEKKKTGESYIEAARRCLREELQVKDRNIEILESTYRQEQKIKESISYPGLSTLFRYHIVEAKVNGLPNTDFWTFESADNELDPISRHHWIWKREHLNAKAKDISKKVKA